MWNFLINFQRKDIKKLYSYNFFDILFFIIVLLLVFNIKYWFGWHRFFRKRMTILSWSVFMTYSILLFSVSFYYPLFFDYHIIMFLRRKWRWRWRYWFCRRRVEKFYRRTNYYIVSKKNKFLQKHFNVSRFIFLKAITRLIWLEQFLTINYGIYLYIFNIFFFFYKQTKIKTKKLFILGFYNWKVCIVKYSYFYKFLNKKGY